MKRKYFLLSAALFAAAAAWLFPGCDDLITEVNNNTIAGHPTADFTVTPDSGCAPLTVALGDLCDGPRDRATFYFYRGSQTTPVDSIILTRAAGDSAILNVDTAYTFDDAGVYAIRLHILNTADGGQDSEYKYRAVIVGTSVLDFGASDTAACPGDEITFEPNVNDWGAVSGWSWSFGDGGTSTDSIPSHTYADTGVYTIGVTVTGPCGQAQLVDSGLIKIVPCPTIVFEADTTEGCAPLNVAFHDLTAPDPDAGFVINRRIWSLGSGANPGSGADVITDYIAAGLYDVSLTLEFAGFFAGESLFITRADTLFDYINVFDSTSSNFYALTPERACYSPTQQFQVLFAPTHAGDFDSLVWTFGDGTTWTDIAAGADPVAKPPVHAYVTPGLYDVTLSAFGRCDTSTTVKSAFVKLSTPLQTDSVGFTMSADSADTSYIFEFTDTTNGMVLNRLWQFGDASQDETAATVTHKYALAAGVTIDTFVVRMSVSNDCGGVEKIDTVIVTETPPTPPKR